MVINRSFSRLYSSSPWTSLLGGEEEQRDGVRIIEDASTVLVSCWLPGFIQDDISVLFRNKQLKITAIRSAGSSERLDVGVSAQESMFDAMIFRDCSDFSDVYVFHSFSDFHDSSDCHDFPEFYNVRDSYDFLWFAYGILLFSYGIRMVFLWISYVFL